MVDRPLGPLGEPDSAAYLRILRHHLPRALGPELGSAHARGSLDMALALLDHLIVRDGTLAEAVAERNRGVAGRDLVLSELQFLRRLAEAEAAVADTVAPAETGSVTAARIEAWLRPRASGGLPVSVVEMGSPLGGYSKDVFVVRLAGAGRPADAIVIRRDLPKGPLEGSVVEEAAVLRAMHRAGIPVAEPLWVEPDPRHFGGAALILRFAEGAPPTDIRAHVGPDAVDSQLRQLARILARIHGVDPQAAGIDRATSDRPLAKHILELLDRFDAQWQRRRAAPNPVIAAGLAWMRANLPGDDPAPVIVHGDCSLRNLLFADGRATAMLDWETWHLGDPAEDLAYCRDEVEAAMPWPEFLAEYRAAGGPAVSEARLRFWSLWKYLRGAITSVSMLNAVSDRSADLRTAFGGVFFTRHCLTRTAELLLARLGEATLGKP
jgi:aminoglycoside phosphotransferase (APT) family kinase protein